VPLDPDFLSFLKAWIDTGRFQAVMKDRKVSMQRKVAKDGGIGLCQ
jgi:hypothetical protein